MSDFLARIKPKRSSATGETPQPSELEVSELAVNTADGRLFVKHTDNSIKEIVSSAEASRTVLGIGEYVDDAAAGVGGVASGALYYNTTSSDYRLKA